MLLEKIALSPKLLREAKLSAMIKALEAKTTEEASKRQRQARLFSDRAFNVHMKKVNSDIDKDLAEGLAKFRARINK